MTQWESTPQTNLKVQAFHRTHYKVVRQIVQWQINLRSASYN